jgi:hypothetical protein
VPVAVHREGMALYRARVTPFAFLIGPTGEVLSKGLVNTAQGLNLLIQRSTEPNGNPDGSMGLNGGGAVRLMEVGDDGVASKGSR